MMIPKIKMSFLLTEQKNMNENVLRKDFLIFRFLFSDWETEGTPDQKLIRNVSNLRKPAIGQNGRSIGFKLSGQEHCKISVTYPD